jgi:hypothetical protein
VEKRGGCVCLAFSSVYQGKKGRLMGWRWKQHCAENFVDIMDYVEQDYPLFEHIGGKYYVFYNPKYVSFDVSQSRLTYLLYFKEHDVSISPVNTVNTFIDLSPCDVSPDVGVFSDLPVQDVMVWLALGLLFLFGFHSGRN